MNGKERIIAKINEEARLRADGIISAAKAQADEFLQNEKARREERAAEIIAHGKKEGESLKELEMKAAKMEARQTLLAARRTLIAEAFSRAKSELVNMSDDEYLKMLVSSAHGLKTAGELVMSKRDRERIGAELVSALNSKGCSLTLADRAAGIEGGFIIVSPTAEYNFSIESIADNLAHEIDGEVAKILFE